MFKKHEIVKLKEPKIHFGTKEFIEIGKIVAIKNRFNPFKKTKYVVLLSDGVILDENRRYSSYLDTFIGKDLIKITL